MPSIISASWHVRSTVLLLLLCATAALLPLQADAALVRTERLVVYDEDEPNGGETGVRFENPYQTPSFTPSNNSLLVVALTVFQGDVDADINPPVVDDSVGLVWTQRTAVFEPVSKIYATHIWTAPVTTGSSMTVSVTGPLFDTGNAVAIHIYDYTGYDTTSPIGATASDDNVTTITLSGTPALTSEVLAILAQDCATTIDVGGSGGFTELNQRLGCNLSMQTQYRTNSISTTVDWTATGGEPTEQFTAGAIEIKAAAQASVSRIIRLRGSIHLRGTVIFR